MIIELDTKTLIDNKINAHQYLIAKMIYDKDFDYLKTYLEVTGGINTVDIETLKKAKFLNDYNTEGSLHMHRLEPRPRLMSLLATGDFFDELLEKYPTSVIRPDGTRDYLRTDLKRCRVLYKKITGKSRIKHNHILNCLNTEIAQKKKDNKMQWMKRLPKWLSSEEWKIYEDNIKDSKKEKDMNGYGQEII